MNEKFLSRGKRLEIGPRIVTTSDEWIYGYYVYGSISTYIYSALHNPKMVSVDPKTVGRCTGLTDKNGKMIFEGDRVRVLMHKVGETPNYMTGFVEWINGAFSVTWDDTQFGRHFVGYLENIEIIGNIHDNPELLKEAAQNGG